MSTDIKIYFRGNSVAILRAFADIRPVLGKRVYVDDSSILIGQVIVEEDVSIWPGVVIRGDVNLIEIGARTNIQDLSVLHVSSPSAEQEEGYTLKLGQDVTIGHQVTLHGCTIADRVLIGISTTVLDGAVIESDVIVGAGSLVPPRKYLESGYLYFGVPVRAVRQLQPLERQTILHSARHYVELKNQYLEGCIQRNGNEPSAKNPRETCDSTNTTSNGQAKTETLPLCTID